MKGIILAGGLGTRLRPLTLNTNKHLLMVHDRPMVLFPLECLVAAGICDALVVTGRAHIDAFARLLGDGSRLGLRSLSFVAQDGEGGIADALKQGEAFAGGDRVCVLLGDNIFGRSLRGPAGRFAAQRSGARLLLAESAHPRDFGVARIEGGRIVEIIEKPTNPPGRLVVTGAYFYDAAVFDICRSIVPSSRGELEITDVNNVYARRGDLEYETLEGWWSDAGTFESLERAAGLVAKTGANRAM